MTKNLALVIFISVGYFVSVFFCLLAAIIAANLILGGVRLIKRQIRLNNSIMLIELVSNKSYCIVSIVIASVLAIVSILGVAGVFGLEFNRLFDSFNLLNWQSRLIFASLLLMLLPAIFYFIVLYLAKSAVVDKGIYFTLSFADWYHVHDYIVDENSGTVIICTCADTFAGLKGTTAPLKVDKNDISKLKFILDRNKNKFS